MFVHMEEREREQLVRGCFSEGGYTNVGLMLVLIRLAYALCVCVCVCVDMRFLLRHLLYINEEIEKAITHTITQQLSLSARLTIVPS